MRDKLSNGQIAPTRKKEKPILEDFGSEEEPYKRGLKPRQIPDVED
jgi:hypothetical protein